MSRSIVHTESSAAVKQRYVDTSLLIFERHHQQQLHEMRKPLAYLTYGESRNRKLFEHSGNDPVLYKSRASYIEQNTSQTPQSVLCSIM